jgi:uncharacterized protein YjiS (DUF1127 family)
MKYEPFLHRSRDCNHSLLSDCARWLTGALIEHGVRRGRFLQGLAVRRAFIRLAISFRGIARTIAIWRNHARMRGHLARMDDRLLDDIGVSRLDAKREINKPFWRE